MVYSKELECDATTAATAKAILRLKTLAFIPSKNMMGSIFLRRLIITLPIKMTREKFQRKRYYFYEKDSRFNPRLIHKSSFLIGQVPIEKYGLKTLFLLFNI